MQLKTIIKLIISLSLCFYSLVIIAQNGFEIRLDSYNIDDNFVSIACNNSGYLYCALYSVPAEIDSSHISKSYLYRISPEGDSIFFDYQVPDTLLMLPLIHVDSNSNVLLGGIGWKYDSITGISGKFHYFIKLNSDLDIIWRKKFQLEPENFIPFNSVLDEDQEGDYLLAATSVSIPGMQSVMSYVFRFSAEGDSIDIMELDDEYIGNLSCFTKKNNSNDIFLHMENGPPPPAGDISGCKRLKLSDSLVPISYDSYPGRFFDAPFYTNSYQESSYVSFGTSWDLILGEKERDYYLDARIMDSSLNIIHEIKLTDPERKAYAAWDKGVDYYYPNRIYVVGMDNLYANITYPNSTDYIYVACLDENLDIIHEEYIGNENDFFLINSMAATPDGGVAIAGGVYDITQQNYKYDGYILKIDSGMFVGIPENPTREKATSITISPNPAHDRISVSATQGDVNFSLFDLEGRMIFQTRIQFKTSSINISSINPGLYIWKAELRDKAESGKLLVY